MASSYKLGERRGLSWLVLFPSDGVVVGCLQIVIGARYPIYSVGHGWRTSGWRLVKLVERRGFALFVFSLLS